MFVVAHGGASGTAPGAAEVATVALAVGTVGAYLLASRPLRLRALRPALPRWRVAAFVTGTLVLTVAVSSPVEHQADELFWAHMVQHLVLAFVAAPLLVVGRPVLVAGLVFGRRLHAVSRPLRRLGVRLRSLRPVAAALVLVHVAPWVFWHVPAAYELALRSTPVHLLEHVTMLASGAALAWLAVGHRSLAPAAAGIVLGMTVMGVVAATLSFAGDPLYAGHVAADRGLTVLEDQQVGGALMWFPGSLPYLAAAAVIVLARLGLGPAAPAGSPAHHWSYR
jgi:putative membrane protein